MRLRLALAFTALVALAACDQGGQKAGSARAPIGATPAATDPAKTAAATPAANCPTVAPACPTPAAATKTAKAAPKRHRVVRTGGQQVRTVKVVSTARSYSHAQDGLPRRPYRYEELTRYSDEPAVRPYEDGGYYAYDERPASGYHYYERKEGRREEVRKDYRRHDSDTYADRGYRAERDQQRYERRETYDDRYAYEDDRRYEREERHAYAPPPPPPSPRPSADTYDRSSSGGYDRADRYGQSGSRYYTRESAGRSPSGNVRYRSSTTAESNYVTHSSSTGGGSVVVGDGGCCTNGQAAGFDSRGYLTWPGKTPR